VSRSLISSEQQPELRVVLKHDREQYRKQPDVPQHAAFVRTAPPPFLHQLPFYFPQPRQSIILLRNVGNLLRFPPLLGLLHLVLSMKPIQKLPRRFRGRDPVSQQLLEPAVLRQMREIFQALPAQRVQHHKTFHDRGFIVAAVALLDLYLAPNAGRKL
jgi:hypothetical protein